MYNDLPITKYVEKWSTDESLKAPFYKLRYYFDGGEWRPKEVDIFKHGHDLQFMCTPDKMPDTWCELDAINYSIAHHIGLGDIYDFIASRGHMAHDVMLSGLLKEVHHFKITPGNVLDFIHLFLNFIGGIFC